MIHPLRIGILVGCNLILDGLAAKNSEKLDRKKSIADLLKLVEMEDFFSISDPRRRSPAGR